ncbi:MAG: PTS sugar transporter subunit IIA [Erysipelotrichaceae bacterium]|nr:PTS sugar transporter subunit IIA [Erysipelotrichaceae bacterium]
MKIRELIKKEAIKLGASPKTKEEAIDELVALHVAAGNVADAAAYKEAILKRESEGSTGMGDGIAIPHARTSAVKEAGLAYLGVPEGVDFESMDGSLAKTLFMIAAPDDSNNFYMEVLSRLATLLINPDFVARLQGAKTADELLGIIDEAESDKLEADEKKEEERAAATEYPQILAVTACPTGIAHTYMAAENLEKKAKEMGVTLKAETQGSVGAKNVLTPEEIKAAKGIIVAADKNVEMARFAGKPVYVTNVSRGINEPEVLINKILNDEAPVYESDKKVEVSDSNEKDSVWHTIYKNLMNGVSHMLPFIVGGGILIALSFLVDNQAINPGGYGSNTPLAAFFHTVGSQAFGFMLPILAGYIAMSIADRPGLAVGFVGGALANAGYSFAWLADRSTNVVSAGFLGALLAGFAGGYLTLAIEKACDKLPDSLEGIKPVLIYPLCGILLIGIMMFAVNPIMAGINTGITNVLSSMGTANLVLLGAVVGGMMSVDMGGPVNKAAYVFGTAMLAAGTDAGKIIMASVMVGGMVPPLAVALSTTLFKNKWTEEERKAGLVNYIMGLSFISEGAIPYAAADPLRVLPACIIGSAVAGGISAAAKCMSPAPHGGLWVVAVISNPLMYVVALLAGSLVAAFILSFLKKSK